MGMLENVGELAENICFITVTAGDCYSVEAHVGINKQVVTGLALSLIDAPLVSMNLIKSSCSKASDTKLCTLKALL